MADATRSQLEQAYRLIQKEDLDNAIAILRPITASQPDNADAWWLLANAVNDPNEAHQALSNVVRLKPNHPEANDLLAKLNAEFPSLASGGSTGTGFSDDDPGFDDIFNTPASAAPAPAAAPSFSSDDLDALLNDKYPSQSDSSRGGFSSQNVDDMFGSDAPFDDPFASSGPQFVQDPDLEPGAGKRSKPPKPQREGRPKPVRVTRDKPPADALDLERRANRRPNPVLIIAVLLVLAILVGGGFVGANLLGLFGTPAPSTPTIDPVQQALVTTITTANAQIAASGFQNPKTAVVPSDLGNTLTVQLCTTGGPDLQNKIYKVMDIMATFAAGIRDRIKGVGVQFVSCNNPGTWLYRAVAPIDAVVAYVDGGRKDTRTFHAAWVKQ